MHTTILHAALASFGLFTLVACTAEPDEATTTDNLVELTPARTAELRDQIAAGAVRGPDVPDGARVFVAVGEPPATPRKGISNRSCAETDRWLDYPVAEPITVCGLNPPVCVDWIVETNETVTCVSVASSCVAPTTCTASGLAGNAHGIQRPGTAPSSCTETICFATGVCITAGGCTPP